MKNRTKAIAVLFAAVPTLFGGKAAAQPPPDLAVTIIANPGPFDSIEQAAVSENKVNFWDDNFEDDDACTECFAAVELRRFLTACTGIPSANIQLAWTKELPKSGYVFVIGNRRSNPLVGSLPAKGDRARLLPPRNRFASVWFRASRQACASSREMVESGHSTASMPVLNGWE